MATLAPAPGRRVRAGARVRPDHLAALVQAAARDSGCPEAVTPDRSLPRTAAVQRAFGAHHVLDVATCAEGRDDLLLELAGRAFAAARGVAVPAVVAHAGDGAWLLSRRAANDRLGPAEEIQLATHAIAFCAALRPPPPPDLPVAHRRWRASRLTLPMRAGRAALGHLPVRDFLAARSAAAALPDGEIAHGDLHPGNLLLDRRDGSAVLVDWTHLGPAPVGTDLLRWWVSCERPDARALVVEDLLSRTTAAQRPALGTLLWWLALRELAIAVTSAPVDRDPGDADRARRRLPEARALAREWQAAPAVRPGYAAAEPRAVVVRGPAALRALADLAPLFADAPLTARPPWLIDWARAHPEVEPVLVRVGDDAAAPLARQRRGGLTLWTGMGHGDSDEIAWPARGPAAAGLLAEGVVALLTSTRGPWRLRVEQLPHGHIGAGAVAAQLPAGGLIEGVGAPWWDFVAGDGTAAALSKSVRRAIRTTVKGYAQQGLAWRVELLQDPAAVRAALPEAIRLHRERDHALGRRSDLDAPSARDFYVRCVEQALATEGAVLARLEVGGRLAAYDLHLRDGATVRLKDGRVDPSAGGSPGWVLVEAAAALHVREARHVRWDWMRGATDYKLRCSSGVVAHEHLVAWSSPRLRAAEKALHAGRQRARAAVPDDLVRRLRSRLRSA